MNPKRSRSKPRRDRGRPRGEPVESAMLARTLEELAEHGIEGASVDRIARAAEVNKTSVYRRFGTREALIAAALERVAVDVSAQVSDQGSLSKDLALVAEHVVALLGSPMGQSLARAAFTESSGSEIAALATREMKNQRNAALAIAARARARGEWQKGISPEPLFSALIGALIHRALLERAPLSPTFVRQLVELLAAGVRPRDER